MARTRPDVSRDDKRTEILDAAERRLLDGGYDAMSIAAISRELGVAQNTVYWYFESKDDLLLAVVQRLLPRIAEAKPPHDKGLMTQVLWFVERLAEHKSLRTTLQERARHSAAVSGFVEEFHQLLASMLAGALRSVVPPDELDDATNAFLATVEGVLARDIPERERSRILVYSLGRLVHPR